MLPYRLAMASHLPFLRAKKLQPCRALAGALLLTAVTAGCGSMSHISTATPTARATATPTPLPPTSAGVYLLTPNTLDVLSLADGRFSAASRMTIQLPARRTCA
jgi:hypothetical protein